MTLETNAATSLVTDLQVHAIRISALSGRMMAGLVGNSGPLEAQISEAHQLLKEMEGVLRRYQLAAAQPETGVRQ